MSISNRQRVEEGLHLAAEGLAPFVARELQALYGERWKDEAIAAVRRGPDDARDFSFDDVAFLLSIMQVRWNEVFRRTLGRSERTLVNELIDVRNKWAHEGASAFSTREAYRALDTTHLLLAAVAAGEQAAAVERLMEELWKVRMAEETRREAKAVSALFEAKTQPDVKPWREVVAPHEDVAGGRYVQAEFAADLAQVYRGEGVDEYRDPGEFFRRTYLTEGLRGLLGDAVLRLCGRGGVPIRDLQTSFGGGKTHSLLALYHLFSGADVQRLSGMAELLAEVGVERPPEVHRAVLVGTSIGPGESHAKPDGTTVNTLWGELAWQLGGAEGYALLADSDRSGTSPGAQLNTLFERYSPCLVLIDEWVAYARQLYGKDGLPAGSFDAHFTFAQALTEAARAVPGTLLVISIPASDWLKGTSAAGSPAWDVEIGGEGGRAALERLRSVVGRMESPWRPASAEESFEIVRRRLFVEISDPEAARTRDAVAHSFVAAYRAQSQEFPSGVTEKAYEERLIKAYPIHPELFDRLYEDWSSLERFQRTRGVLRLMAAVIHTLWVSEDRNPLILPASVPLSVPAVADELTRYLEDNWKPVIEKDVDGPGSLPLRLDKELPNLGRYSAARRVARTVFVGSAPTATSAHRGIDDRRIKLGCALPGESPAVFGDALRRLSDQATHLYVDQGRYWLETQPSVTQLARDRAGQFRPDEVQQELIKRVRERCGRGQFAGVHVAPASSGDLPDDDAVRLVVLGPEAWHSAKTEDSPARAAAQELLDQRGNAARTNRNMLVFLAPDRSRLAELEDAVRQYLSWHSIVEQAVALNLNEFSKGQAQTKREQSAETITQRIPETYQWLLIPSQPDPHGPEVWEQLRLQGQEELAVRASRRMVNDQSLITAYGGVSLHYELERIPLWRGEQVGVKQLWDDFTKYLYLPRLRDATVLLEAIRDGLGSTTWVQDGFAYAAAFDETQGRYQGLCCGHADSSILMDGRSVLIKPAVALRQREADEAAALTDAGPKGGDGQGSAAGRAEGRGGQEQVAGGPARPKSPIRYHGRVLLEPERLNKQVPQIAEAVVQHLTKLNGAHVEVTLEIQAEVSGGIEENVVRTVSENSKTLKFEPFGFEEE